MVQLPGAPILCGLCKGWVLCYVKPLTGAARAHFMCIRYQVIYTVYEVF